MRIHSYAGLPQPAEGTKGDFAEIQTGTIKYATLCAALFYDNSGRQNHLLISHTRKIQRSQTYLRKYLNKPKESVSVHPGFFKYLIARQKHSEMMLS